MTKEEMDAIVAGVLAIIVFSIFLARFVYCLIEFALAKDYRKGSIFEFTHEKYLTHCLGCNHLEQILLDLMVKVVIAVCLFGLYDLGLVSSMILIGSIVTFVAFCVIIVALRNKNKKLRKS